MIRVLLVPSSDYLGHPFPQRHNQIFERLHDGKNFEVHVVRFRLFDKPKLKTNLIIHELENKRANNTALYYLVNALKHASQIRKIVREESIDVVVLSNLAAPLAFTLMDELSDLHIPIIFDLPDYYPTSATGYIFDVKSIFGKLVAETLNLTLLYMMKHATVATAASLALAEYAKRAGARTVAYVPNGISECFLKLHDSKELREKLGYEQEDLVVGYIGSVEFWLDMRSLLKGVALARKRQLPANVLIVGRRLQTGYSEKVSKYIGQEGLEKYTTWLDFVPHEKVPEYMGVLDVGTIPFDLSNPTAYFAAPNKMWEYLSQLKPVISTPIPEVVSNSDCVLTALTPADYANNFRLALEKAGVYQKINVGYSRALTKTWKNSASAFALVIRSILDKKK